MSVKRGDIYYADLSPVIGSEQGGLRPVLIIQNDVGNRYSPTVIAAAITSRLGKTKLPTHIDIYADKVGLAKNSVILLEQIRTLDKRRLKEKMGHLDEDMMSEVNNAIAVSFGLGNSFASAGGAPGTVGTPVGGIGAVASTGNTSATSGISSASAPTVESAPEAHPVTGTSATRRPEDPLPHRNVTA